MSGTSLSQIECQEFFSKEEGPAAALDRTLQKLHSEVPAKFQKDIYCVWAPPLPETPRGFLAWTYDPKNNDLGRGVGISYLTERVQKYLEQKA